MVKPSIYLFRQSYLRQFFCPSPTNKRCGHPWLRSFCSPNINATFLQRGLAKLKLNIAKYLVFRQQTFFEFITSNLPTRQRPLQIDFNVKTSFQIIFQIFALSLNVHFSFSFNFQLKLIIPKAYKIYQCITTVSTTHRFGLFMLTMQRQFCYETSQGGSDSEVSNEGTLFVILLLVDSLGT